MVLEKLILEGIVGILSDSVKRPSEPGRFVFELVDSPRVWSFAVEYPNFKLPHKLLLSSRDLGKLPFNFVERATEGHLSFQHITTRSIITIQCNPSNETNLEDAVILLQAINNRTSFEMQKTVSGFPVHKMFVNTTLDVRRRRGSGCPARSLRDRRGSYQTPYRVPDREQFHNGSFKSLNSVEYKRNDSSYSRGKMRGNSKRNNSQPVYYGGKYNNGFRDRRSLDTPSDECRNREHVSRKQQPLKDRGSAENSLDRSEEEREISHDASFLGNSPMKNKSSDKITKHNSNVQNENEDPTAQESPNRTPEKSSQSSESSSPTSSYRGVEKNSTKVDSESPFSRGIFYGKVRQNRQFGTAKSFTSPPYRPRITTNSNWNSTPVKKNKIVSSNFENKENELDTSLSSFRSLRGNEIGFKNIGMTCYMNTSLWSLFNVEIFSNDLLLAYNSIKDSLEDKSVLRSVCNLLIATRSKDKSKCGDNYKCYLQDVIRSIVAKWKEFNVHNMQDAQEFIQRILNSMKDELEDVLKTVNRNFVSSFSPNPIKKNFEFVIEETVTCCNCSKACSKQEIHYDMGVCVPKSRDPDKSKSLQTAINSFFRIEEREAVCDNCQHNKCRVESKISKLPCILIVYLKRYKTSKITTGVMKNELPVDIPKYITLGDFTADGATLNDGDDKCERTNLNGSCSTTDSAFGSADETVTHEGKHSCDTKPCSTSDDLRLDSGLGGQINYVTEAGDPENDSTQVPDAGGDDGLLNESAHRKRTSTPVDENALVPMEMEWNEEEEMQEAISKSLQQEDDDELEKAKLLSLEELNRTTQESVELDDSEEIEDDEESDLSKANHSIGELPDSYRLMTVATHFGSLSAGHYTCITYTTDSKWKLYDDDDVSYRSEEAAMNLVRERGYVMIYIHKSLMERRGNL